MYTRVPLRNGAALRTVGACISVCVRVRLYTLIYIYIRVNLQAYTYTRTYARVHIYGHGCVCISGRYCVRHTACQACEATRSDWTVPTLRVWTSVYGSVWLLDVYDTRTSSTKAVAIRSEAWAERGQGWVL